jgi:hypothetical protein
LPALDLMKSNWKVAVPGLNLPNEAAVKEKMIATFLQRLLTTLITFDDAAGVRQILDRYSDSIGTNHSTLAGVLQRTKRIEEIRGIMSPEDRLVLRESDYDCWHRFSDAVRLLRQAMDSGISLIESRENVQRILVELVCRLNPDAAVLRATWYALPDLHMHPLSVQLEEIDRLLARCEVGDIDLPPGLSQAQIHDQILLERDYVVQKGKIARIFVRDLSQRLEDQLDAVNAANRCIALTSQLSVVNGSMLFLRSMIYSKMGLRAKAYADLNRARSTYMPHPRSYRRSLKLSRVAVSQKSSQSFCFVVSHC